MVDEHGEAAVMFGEKFGRVDALADIMAARVARPEIQSLSNSLIAVFDRVFSSTRFTITAQ
jgi:hypothetical protein